MNELDAYSTCICGSGKKVKFCCNQFVDDMLRISRLFDQRHFPMVLQALDAFSRKPGQLPHTRAWARLIRVGVHESADELEAAEKLVQEVLQEIPDHPMANLKNASLRLFRSGYFAAQDAIERGFFSANGRLPRPAALVAHLSALKLIQLPHPLAAIAYATLAARLEPNIETINNTRDYIASRLSHPYPLRRTYPVRVPVEEQAAPTHEMRKTIVLAGLGCWSQAAKRFQTAAEAQTGAAAAVLWGNVAMCRANVGDDAAAVAAFRKAAAAEPDFDKAVEAEAMAQLVATMSLSEKAWILSTSIPLANPASQVLSVLDRHPRLRRLNDSSSDPEVAAAYSIAAEVPAGESFVRQLAKLNVNIVDQNAAGGSAMKTKLILLAPEGVENEEACQLIRAIPEFEISIWPESQQSLAMPVEILRVMTDLVPPADLTTDTFQTWVGHKRELTQTAWLNTPLPALGGKTPIAAAAAPELKTALAAAVMAFEAVALTHGVIAEMDLLRNRLGVSAPQPLRLAPGAALDALSGFEIRRLDLHELADLDLLKLVNICLNLKLDIVLNPAAEEMLTRPDLAGQPGVAYLCRVIAQKCFLGGRYDEGYLWLARGRDTARGDTDDEIMERLQLDILEFNARIRQPADPEFMTVAVRLWNYFGPKFPNLREQFRPRLMELGVSGPWNAESEFVGAGSHAADAAAGEGLWTPAANPPASEQKLWLPGQPE